MSIFTEMPRQPKESFVLLPYGKEWNSIVAKSEALEFACDYALLQLQYEMPGNTHPGLPTDPYVGLDANAQMQGARRVLDILKTLHEPVKQPTQPKRESLHY